MASRGASDHRPRVRRPRGGKIRCPRDCAARLLRDQRAGRSSAAEQPAVRAGAAGVGVGLLGGDDDVARSARPAGSGPRSAPAMPTCSTSAGGGVMACSRQVSRWAALALSQPLIASTTGTAGSRPARARRLAAANSPTRTRLRSATTCVSAPGRARTERLDLHLGGHRARPPGNPGWPPGACRNRPAPLGPFQEQQVGVLQVADHQVEEAGRLGAVDQLVVEGQRPAGASGESPPCPRGPPASRAPVPSPGWPPPDS